MNVLGCNDQFFNVFINICVFGASFTMALLNNLVPGRMGLNYFMCTGEDQRDYEHLESKVSICTQIPVTRPGGTFFKLPGPYFKMWF